MTSEIAAMLDELMGRGRNEEAGKQTQRGINVIFLILRTDSKSHLILFS